MDVPNYTIPVAPPSQSFGQGYQLGAGIRDDQFQQQQQAAQLAQQQQQAQVIHSLIANPNAGADDYSKALLLAPSFKDNIDKAWSMKNTAQQQAHLSDVSRWFAAAKSGSPEIAEQAMRDRADAMENAKVDPQQVQALRVQADVLKAHPEFSRTMMGMMLSALPGGDRVLQGAASVGADARADALSPSQIQKSQADADRATTEAGIAAATAPEVVKKAALENMKIGEDTESVRFKRRIDALDTQIRQADSETKRGELQLQRDKLVQEQGQTATNQAQEAQGQLDFASNTIDKVNQLFNHPGLGGYFFGAGTIGGKQAGYIPGTDAKDFRSMLDTLKSNVFMQQLQQMKQMSKTGASGMGALSEKEGDKVERVIANLDADQSEGQLKGQLTMVRKYFERAQQILTAQGHLPTAGGGAFVMQHPKFGTIRDGDINRLMTKNPGATREQVIQYLQQTGGK